MHINFVKKYGKNIGICFVGFLFFIVYSYLNFNNPHRRFSWPDEMATYFSATTFAKSDSFSVPALHTDIAGNLISPRSMQVWQGNLVPTGFLGLPIIYGFAAKVIGTYLILFLTPLLAVLGAYFFYRILKLYFEEPIALLSGILLLFLPAYSYYSSFSMLTNVPQIALLIIGLYFLISALVEKKTRLRSDELRRGEISWHPVVSGLLIGVSLIIRPNEVIWIAPLVIFFIVANRKIVKPVTLIRFLLFLSMPLILLGFAQHQTYGHWYLTGYSLPQAATTLSNPHSALNYFFPFGINLFESIKNLAVFVGSTHWLFLVLATVGALMAFLRETERKWRVLLILSLLLWTYLGLMYGSWRLGDDLILGISRLGVSYNRYLLPAMISMLPFVSYLLVRIYRVPAVRQDPSGKALRMTAGKVIAIFLGIWCLGFGVSKVYLQGNDSLPKIKASIAEYNDVHEQVLKLTPENSIIETLRGDKVVFPERQVVAQYSDADMEPLGRLRASVPYFYLVSSADAVNLPAEAKLIQVLSENFTLYGN